MKMKSWTVVAAMNMVVLSMLAEPGPVPETQKENAKVNTTSGIIAEGPTENGGAETVDADGIPLGWTTSPRKCKIVVTQDKEDKTEGTAAAKIEASNDSGEGNSFSVNLGIRPPAPTSQEMTYLFTADVKSDIGKGSKLIGLFRLGQEDYLKTPRFNQGAGWQKVSERVTIPVNKPFGRLEFQGVITGSAVIRIDNVRLVPAPTGETGK